MADDKAQKMGVSFPEYVRHLLLNSVQTEINNQYLLSEREETSIGRSLNDIKKGDYSVLKTTKDINDFVDNL